MTAQTDSDILWFVGVSVFYLGWVLFLVLIGHAFKRRRK